MYISLKKNKEICGYFTNSKTKQTNKIVRYFFVQKKLNVCCIAYREVENVEIKQIRFNVI